MSGDNKLLELFQLEQIDNDFYRGISLDLGFRSLFGGQVLSQALMAATRTVDATRAAHSLHAYFLRPGDAQAPIDYRVMHLRDGRGFTTRRVEALQHGRHIFELMASFQVPEEGFDHQDSMPEGQPAPETLRNEHELLSDANIEIPERLRLSLEFERPIDIRPTEGLIKLTSERREPVKHVWFRAPVKLPDDPLLHRAILAYASDFELLGTAMQPHGVSFFQDDVLAASLDHSLWIHRPFRADEWLLYSIYSPNAHGARGLIRGQIFSRDGVLVASSMQEGLVRVLS